MLQTKPQPGRLQVICTGHSFWDMLALPTSPLWSSPAAQAVATGSNKCIC